MFEHDIPENRKIKFNPNEPSIRRAMVIFKEFHDNIDLFEREVDKAFRSDNNTCLICGYRSYGDNNRCKEHNNVKIKEQWPDDNVIIPENKLISIKRRIEE